VDKNESKIYEIFKALNIVEYQVREHVAIFSTEDSDRYGLAMEGLNLKNLLIREKKTETFFLVIIDEHTQMDMKHFKEVTGWKKVRFADENELWELLHLSPGAVTPLALFNDIEHRIKVVLGKDIVIAPEDEKISFHPCRNTATLTMRKGDFLKFLEYMGNDIILEQPL